MASKIQQILDFFAEPGHSLNAVESIPLLFEEEFGSIIGGSFSPEFKSTYDKIKKYRGKIDEMIVLEEEKQVVSTLKYIQKRKHSRNEIESIHFFKYLVNKLLYPNWPDYLKHHYDALGQILVDWKDYFLSYSRNKNDLILQNPEDINQKYYKKFIRRILGKDVKKSPEWKTENLLALAIVKLLREENLNDFFDINDIDIGDPVEEKIKDWSGKSFSLLQLIHITMFNNTVEPKKNWCFKEYCHFNRANDKMINSNHFCLATLKSRCFYLLAGKDIQEIFPNAGYDEAYDDWVDEITNKKYDFIDPDLDFEHNYQLIKDLSRKMIEVKIKLIEHVQTPH